MPESLLQSAGITIAFRSEEFAPDEFINVGSRWIPSLRRLYERPDSADISIDCDLGQNRLEYFENGFVIRGSYDKYHVLLDAAALLSRFLERELNRRKRYSFHGSCVVDQDKAFLLLGPEGVGKTTAAAACCLRKPTIRILSSDRTVVEDNLAIAGTTTLTFRKGSLVHELPQLVGGTISGDDLWDNKVSVDFSSALCSTACRLAGFFFIRTSGMWSPMRLLTGPEKLVKLYDQLTYFAQAFPSISVGQRQPVPIFFSYETEGARIEYATELVRSIPAYVVSGSLDQVVTALLENINGATSEAALR